MFITFPTVISPGRCEGSFSNVSSIVWYRRFQSDLKFVVKFMLVFSFLAPKTAYQYLPPYQWAARLWFVKEI